MTISVYRTHKYDVNNDDLEKTAFLKTTGITSSKSKQLWMEWSQPSNFSTVTASLSRVKVVSLHNKRVTIQFTGCPCQFSVLPIYRAFATLYHFVLRQFPQ